jgi:hypothetical protein
MPQSPISFNLKSTSNALIPYTADKQGGAIVTAAHGNKYWSTYNLKVFLGANPSGVTTSAGLATTYVGLCLSNPAGSAVNLSIRRVAGAFIVAPATVTGLNLITGFAAGGVTVHTTPLTPVSGMIGNAATAAGKLDSACTLVGTPVYTQVLSETSTATTLPFFSVDLEGAIILPPGAYAAIGTTIAGPTSGFQGSFEWTEWPV